ncbi:hypothetical protein [Xanthomonas sacchari]|uniref:hypothetical protein n=1 Tax=Xanthomonas sacchari TaxID=56458 RepID=UPI002254F769|nr:hypothetical protein [Xanthomonas sacchari]
MTENQRDEVVLLAMSASGLKDRAVVVSISEKLGLREHKGADAAPASLSTKYDIITDDARAKRLVRKHKNSLVNVAKVHFFSHSSGIEVVEIATFDENFVIPVAVTFSVKYQGDGLVFLTAPTKDIAVGHAVAEEGKELIKKQEVSGPASRRSKLKR